MNSELVRLAVGIRARLLPIFGLLILTGCGGDSFERGTVHGQVSFQGEGIKKGYIQFSPVGITEGRSCGADIIEGKYAIDVNGPAVGLHRVEIQAFRTTGRKVPDLLGDVSDSNRAMIDEVVPVLPAKFNVDSDLTAEIKSGENVVNFDL